MTPSARIQSAADLLDQILDGAPAEKTLTTWARKNRYAGSKDRAAVRDHVYSALRRMRSFAVLGGAMSGRGLMVGALREIGADLDTIFNGEGYGPTALTDAERDGGQAPSTRNERLDLPDWLADDFFASLGDKAEENAIALQQRAPVFLRVNTIKADIKHALEELSFNEITAQPHALSPSALEVLSNPRRVAGSEAYREGLVELQDGASQAVVDQIVLRDGLKILDYCAGGGGKTLALAARAAGHSDISVFAHDANPARLKDLPDRALRAGANIQILTPDEIEQHGPFDVVLCDVPCSGSGAWRRAPEGKWALTADRLKELNALQDQILDDAQNLVAPNGLLAYATCSLLHAENQARVSAFLERYPSWAETQNRQWLLGEGGDGFFTAHLSHT